LFFDGMVARGRLDFDLDRWSGSASASAAGRRHGDQWFGALTLGYERRNALERTITGYGRVEGHRATLDPYQETGLGIFDLRYGQQEMTNHALAAGIEGDHPIKGERASWRPFWGLEYRKALENRGDVSVNYVQRPASRDYTLSTSSYYDDLLLLRAGIDLQLNSGWMVSVVLGHEQGNNALSTNSVGLQVRYGARSGVETYPGHLIDEGLGGAP
jgi:hypothetical protein